jgi:hypothetical protein
VVATRGRARWADGLLLAALFSLLLVLSWRRWASFTGDLNREWTTPARLAAGEHLYRDVGFYYGPLAPELESLAFRLFGARVGTAIGFGPATTPALLGLLLAFARRHLSREGFLAAGAPAIGVFAFAPENGAFVAGYSQSALLAVALAWGALLAAGGERPLLAGTLAGLALLSKSEALPALLGPLLLLPRGTRVRAIAIAAAVTAAGYGIFLAGIPFAELVTYGPLRHLALPPEFRRLYLEVAGLAPHLLRRGLLGALAGAALLAGWGGVVHGLLAHRPKVAAVGAAAITVGLGVWAGSGPLISTCVRGTPILLAIALLLAWRRHRQGDPDALPVLAAGLLAAGFLWRTLLWTVPLFPYAPLAAVSSVVAVSWLLESLAPAEAPRPALSRALLLAPLLLAPLFFLPRLVVFYRSPRTTVRAPRGTWVPPDPEGELFSRLVAHLERTGIGERGLVVLPEASALGFLMGARSPLRLEQMLPGHLDERADADAKARLEAARPERIVLFERPTDEYGRGRLGADYGRRLMAAVVRGWRPEVRFSAAAPDGRPRTATVLVLRR